MEKNFIKILIIEDEPDVVETCERMLKRRLNTEVLSLPNWRSAIELIQITPFDLILLDLSIEGCDGYEVMQEVRKFNQDVKILVISGHHDENISKEKLELIATQSSGKLLKGTDQMPEILNKIVELFGKSVLLDLSTLKEEEFTGSADQDQVNHALRGIVGVVYSEIEDYFYSFKNGLFKDRPTDVHIARLQGILQNTLRSMRVAQNEINKTIKP